MREILFRGKRVDNGEWVGGTYFYNVSAKRGFIVNVGIDHISPVAWTQEVIPETVGQYTGLNDSTKWQELSDEEKQDFYNENYSEDGETIKYQQIEDVRSLWKGRKIFEDDIIRWENWKCNHLQRKVEFENEWIRFCVRINGAESMGVNVHLSDDIKIVGNIHDNPELIRGEI